LPPPSTPPSAVRCLLKFSLYRHPDAPFTASSVLT
jgi:hypothetical protein